MRIRELRAKAREDGSNSKMLLALPFFGLLVLSFVLEAIPQFISNELASSIVNCILSILALIITVSGSYALITRYLKVIRKEEITSFTKEMFGSAIKNGWSVVWGIFKRVWVWILVEIIACIMMVYGSVQVMGGITAAVRQSSSGIVATPDLNVTLEASAIMFVGSIISIISSIKLAIESYKYTLTAFLKHDYPDKSTNELLDKSVEMMDGNKAKAFVMPFTFIGWILLSILVSVLIVALISIPLVNFAETAVFDLFAGIVVYFILSFVCAYLLMTYTEFYLERNPLEIYNADYVKPETNPSKYKKIMTLIICLIILVPFIIGIIEGYMAKDIANHSVSSLNSLVEQAESYQLNQ